MKRRTKTIYILLGIVGVLSVAAGLYIFHLLYSPAVADSVQDPTLFTIEKGESLDSISRRLHASGLLLDPVSLKLAIFIRGGSKNIKAGRHSIPSGLNAWQIYELLLQSPPKEFVVLTIPEGKDMFEIAEAIEAAELADAKTFIEIASKADPILEFAPTSTSLEGFLFPDTYHIPIDSTAQEIVDMMLRRAQQVLTENLQAAFEEAGMTLEEGIILASLVAKEAGNETEMPEIASVFHNRLERGMKLDCDPTFIYAAKLSGVWDRKIHQSDIKRDSPYNTYLHEGLPPGPIANPGAAALWAAAKPADTDYIFFVAKSADQSEGHYFSSTYSEHLRNVQKYRQAKRQAANN